MALVAQQGGLGDRPRGECLTQFRARDVALERVGASGARFRASPAVAEAIGDSLELF